MPLVLIFIAEFVPVSPLLMLVSAALKLQACQEGPKRVTKEIHLLERKRGDYVYTKGREEDQRS